MRKSFTSEGQFGWDATSLETASDCLQKYKYSIIDGLQPARKSVHLIFGGLYATALEHFYKHLAKGLPRDEALRLVVREALISSWDHPRDENGARLPGGQAVDMEAPKTRTSLIRSIVWYVDQFLDDSDDGIRTYYLQSGEPAVELSFVLEFTDELLWAGHLDRVVHYGDSLYWMDQKTTKSAIGSYFFEDFKTSNQFMGYTWAGRTLLKSAIPGGIIDAVQIGVNFSRFGRAPITFAPDQLEEWRDQALYHIARAREAVQKNYFPKNFSACGKYGGCPFRELCGRSPSVRERFLEGSYTHRESLWDPLTPR